MPNTYIPHSTFSGSGSATKEDFLSRIVSGHSPMICADILKVNTTYQFMVGAHKFTLTTIGDGVNVTMTLAHWGRDDKITNSATRTSSIGDFTHGFMSIDTENKLRSMLMEIAVFLTMEEVT